MKESFVRMVPRHYVTTEKLSAVPNKQHRLFTVSIHYLIIYSIWWKRHVFTVISFKYTRRITNDERRNAEKDKTEKTNGWHSCKKAHGIISSTPHGGVWDCDANIHPLILFYYFCSPSCLSPPANRQKQRAFRRSHWRRKKINKEEKYHQNDVARVWHYQIRLKFVAGVTKRRVSISVCRFTSGSEKNLNNFASNRRSAFR